MHNTRPAYDSRSAGHAESGVRIVKEKVRALTCFHRGTDGMTGCRRAYGRSRMPRRYVLWSVEVFVLEQSKRKVQVEA